MVRPSKQKKPILLKELCRACGVSQAMIGRAIGMSRSAINLTCNRRYIPVDQPDFKANVESVIRGHSRAMQWLQDRGLTVADVWVTPGNPQKAARADRRDHRGIPQRLKQARQALCLSQKNMAGILGVTARAWQYYESGRSMPGALVITGLVDLGFDANWILSGAGEMTVSWQEQKIKEHASC